MEQEPTEEKDGGGRVVYSRLPSEAGEARPPERVERARQSPSSIGTA